MKKKANHPVKTLEKTVEIIEALKELRSAQLSEIADEVDITKSTIHNHLSTLREHEYVVKEGNEYRLSLQFLTIGGVLRDKFELYDVAKPRIDQLAQETGQLATLATEEQGMAVVLYRAKGEQAIGIDTHVGSQITLHNSALGKSILAHQSPEYVEEYIEHRGLPAVTPNTITDREELYDELERVREMGYAFDDEEQWRGLKCIGAPILTDGGVVKGAISVSAPMSQIENDGTRQEYVDKVKNMANIVELSLTYS
ncbi:IclR family transcriptional regulator [Salinigranum sp. GCM10025319]|uniref:IclR family transcriptional regulator n=1 Tax=Salinigranum sp. GCM10025319 TaxID=3252687 RepID=UPI003618A2DE